MVLQSILAAAAGAAGRLHAKKPVFKGLYSVWLICYMDRISCGRL